jgi:hypothetical protein
MMMDNVFRSEVAQGYIIIYIDDILTATEGNLKDHQKYAAHVLNI